MHLRNSLSTAIALFMVSLAGVHADITSGLVLYLPMNETTGTTVSDASGLGNHGTLTNFSGDDSYWTNGWLQRGLLTGGPTAVGVQYVSIPDAPSLNFNNTNAVNGTSNEFTLVAWVKLPAAQAGGAAILAKGTGGGGEHYDLDMNPSAAPRFRLVMRNSANANATVSSTTTVPDNVWTHVAAVADARNPASQTLRIYINGVSNNTTTTTIMGTLRATTSPVTVGARQSGTGPYNLAIKDAIVDEVRIYNRVLSASDVFELYSLGGFGNTNGTVPGVTTQPRNVTNYVGDAAVFSVAVTGTTPFFYQWFSNDVAIAGQTNAALMLYNVPLSASAAYRVQVTNIIGGASSAPAFLQVRSLPVPNLSANLAGYWKFDDGSGSATAADASGNGSAGALIGFADFSSPWLSGITNGALNFNSDGSGGSVVVIPAVGVPGPPQLDFSTNPAFTLATWVNAPSTVIQSNGAAIIARGTGAGGEQYTLDLPTAGYRFFVRDSSGTAFNLTTTVKPNGTWQHLVGVCDAINGIQNLYINGQLINLTTAPTSLWANAISNEVTIGNRQSGEATPYNLPFTGAIDDARIYSRALAAAEVQALYLTGGATPPMFDTQPQAASRFVGDEVTFSPVVSGTAPLAYQWRQDATIIAGATNLILTLTNLQIANAGTYTLFASNSYGTNLSAPAVLQITEWTPASSLAGHWKFDDGSGSASAVDSSGSGNNGELTAFPNLNSPWVAGRLQGALEFGPEAAYVNVPDSASLNFESIRQFSLAAWVRGSSNQVNGAGIVAKGTGDGRTQYMLDVQNNLFRLVARNASGAATTLSSVRPSGSWQHVVATFDGIAGTMRIYVNGQSVASSAAPTSLFSNTHEVSIGNRQSAAAAYNRPFVGMIDDVRIYNRSLNASQVQELYASAGTFPPAIYSFQPQNGALLAGDSVTISPSVDGGAPLTYQWLKNGTNIPNATNLTHTLQNVQLADAGDYTINISNAAGNASSNIVITVQAVPAPALANSLIAHWPFDETSGLSAADASGNGNTVTLYNFAGDNSQWTPGRIGGALHLNANALVTNQFGATDNPLSLQNGNQFSFGFWARLDAGPRGSNPRFITPSAQSWVLWTPGRGVGFLTPGTSTEPSTNGWTHYVVVFDRVAGTYTLYVNGAREQANLGVYSKTDPTGLLWAIGHSESGTSHNDSWTGLLDDLRVYNRLLNINDARALYYSGGGQPAVSMRREGNTITIVWPAAATGFQLKSTGALGAASVWNDVAGTPVTSADGLTQSLTLTVQDDTQFYRLQK